MVDNNGWYCFSLVGNASSCHHCQWQTDDRWTKLSFNPVQSVTMISNDLSRSCTSRRNQYGPIQGCSILTVPVLWGSLRYHCYGRRSPCEVRPNNRWGAGTAAWKYSHCNIIFTSLYRPCAVSYIRTNFAWWTDAIIQSVGDCSTVFNRGKRGRREEGIGLYKREVSVEND